MWLRWPAGGRILGKSFNFFFLSEWSEQKVFEKEVGFKSPDIKICFEKFPIVTTVRPSSPPILQQACELERSSARGGLLGLFCHYSIFSLLRYSEPLSYSAALLRISIKPFHYSSGLLSYSTPSYSAVLLRISHPYYNYSATG